VTEPFTNIGIVNISWDTQSLEREKETLKVMMMNLKLFDFFSFLSICYHGFAVHIFSLDMFLVIFDRFVNYPDVVFQT